MPVDVISVSAGAVTAIVVSGGVTVTVVRIATKLAVKHVEEKLAQVTENTRRLDLVEAAQRTVNGDLGELKDSTKNIEEHLQNVSEAVAYLKGRFHEWDKANAGSAP